MPTVEPVLPNLYSYGWCFLQLLHCINRFFRHGGNLSSQQQNGIRYSLEFLFWANHFMVTVTVLWMFVEVRNILSSQYLLSAQQQNGFVWSCWIWGSLSWLPLIKAALVLTIDWADVVEMCETSECLSMYYLITFRPSQNSLHESSYIKYALTL